MNDTLDPQTFAQLPLQIDLQYSCVVTATGLLDPQTPQRCFSTTTCFADLPAAHLALQQQLKNVVPDLRTSGRHLCGGGASPYQAAERANLASPGNFLRLRLRLPDGVGRARVFRAFQDLLPLLPALSAASPVHQQRLSGWQATALHLRLHAPEGLREPLLSEQGNLLICSALETQESVCADVAKLALVLAVIRDDCRRLPAPTSLTPVLREALLWRTLDRADSTPLMEPALLKRWGLSGPLAAGAFWRDRATELFPPDHAFFPTLAVLLERGSLAHHLISGGTSRWPGLYAAMARCAEDDRLLHSS